MLASKEDLLFPALDSADRSIDSISVIELCPETYGDVAEVADRMRRATSVLKAGAFARKDLLRGKYWVQGGELNGRLEIEYWDDIKQGINSWIDCPLDPARMCWAQRLLVDKNSRIIHYVLRAHHAFADGLSVQFMTELVLYSALSDKDPPVSISPRLRTLKFHGKKPKNPYAAPEYIQPVTKDGKISGRRRYETLSSAFPVAELSEKFRPAGLTSVLIACSLRGLQDSSLPQSRHQGVCLPMSIREKDCTAIGNGASRVVIFDNRSLGTLQLAAYIKEQIAWNYHNGGWHFPEFPIRWMPLFIFNALIRLSTLIGKSHRGSFIYTGFDVRNLMNTVKGIKNVTGVGPLTGNYSVIITPIILPDGINFVATYNDGCFTADEMSALLKRIESQFTAVTAAVTEQGAETG